MDYWGVGGGVAKGMLPPPLKLLGGGGGAGYRLSTPSSSYAYGIAKINLVWSKKSTIRT